MTVVNLYVAYNNMYAYNISSHVILLYLNVFFFKYNTLTINLYLTAAYDVAGFGQLLKKRLVFC